VSGVGAPIRGDVTHQHGRPFDQALFHNRLGDATRGTVVDGIFSL
jgi:hypothetical protein